MVPGQRSSLLCLRGGSLLLNPLMVSIALKLNAMHPALVCRMGMSHSYTLKVAAVAIVIAAITGSLFSEAPESFREFKTTTGKVFLNAKVLAIEPDGLRLLHDSGVSKVAFADLPVSLRSQFPHDPELAARYAAKTEAANRDAIKRGEQERARADYDERCRRAGLPPGFFIPAEGPLTVEQVKGRWLLENAAQLPSFGERDRAARESAIEYRKQLILSGAFDREAEKTALRHNLDWYLQNQQTAQADVARQRLADMREEESKHAELAVLGRLADSVARLAAESSWRSEYSYELARIRHELDRVHHHHGLNVQVAY
jgi:hypothetical protein